MIHVAINYADFSYKESVNFKINVGIHINMRKKNIINKNNFNNQKLVLNLRFLFQIK